MTSSDTTGESGTDDLTTMKQQLADLQATLAGLSSKVDSILNRHSSFDPGNHLTHLSKFEFHRFDGEDLEGWIFRCDQFFSLDDTDDPIKASIHLDSKALDWHQTYIKTRSLSPLPLTWAEYTLALRNRFGKLYEDPMADLKSLRQDDSVQAYHEAFDTILSKLNLPLTMPSVASLKA